jgi:hypothetical protein
MNELVGGATIEGNIMETLPTPRFKARFRPKKREEGKGAEIVVEVSRRIVAIVVIKKEQKIQKESEKW